MSFCNIEKILDKTWLRNNPEHIFNDWILKSTESNETLLLSRYDTYLKNVTQVLRSKRNIQHKIRNQFEDTYYELEIGRSLMEKGFDLNFEKSLRRIRSQLTPDIFIEKDNLIVEVKALHQSEEEEKGLKSGKFFTINEAKRVQDDLFTELEKYQEQGIEFPVIVVVCPDIIKPPIVSEDDFETVLYYPVSTGQIIGSYFGISSKVKYEGLYSSKYGVQTTLLSGVGLWIWRRKEILFYSNPNAKETSKIPQGKFLDCLRLSKLSKQFHD